MGKKIQHKNKKKWSKPEIKRLPFKQTFGGASRYNTENAFPGFYVS